MVCVLWIYCKLFYSLVSFSCFNCAIVHHLSFSLSAFLCTHDTKQTNSDDIAKLLHYLMATEHRGQKDSQKIEHCQNMRTWGKSGRQQYRQRRWIDTPKGWAAKMHTHIFRSTRCCCLHKVPCATLGCKIATCHFRFSLLDKHK